MKISIFTFFIVASPSEVCYSNDERIRALEIENREQKEILSKMQDQIFSMKTGLAPAPGTSRLALTLFENTFVHDIPLNGDGTFEQTVQAGLKNTAVALKSHI